MIACCGTCTGVRHFKHLQRMSINIGYKGVPVAISEKRLFDMDKWWFILFYWIWYRYVDINSWVDYIKLLMKGD